MAKSDDKRGDAPTASKRPSNRDLGIAAGATLATGLAAVALFKWQKGKSATDAGTGSARRDTSPELAVGGYSPDPDAVAKAERDDDAGSLAAAAGIDDEATNGAPGEDVPMQYTGDRQPDMAVAYLPGDQSVAVDPAGLPDDGTGMPPPLRVDDAGR